MNGDFSLYMYVCLVRRAAYAMSIQFSLLEESLSQQGIERIDCGVGEREREGSPCLRDSGTKKGETEDSENKRLG